MKTNHHKSFLLLSAVMLGTALAMYSRSCAIPRLDPDAVSLFWQIYSSVPPIF